VQSRDFVGGRWGGQQQHPREQLAAEAAQ